MKERKFWKKAIIIILIIVLLFIVVKCRKDGNKDEKKAAIENTHFVFGNNLNDLIRLLNSADICSELWFQDLDDYIDRLEEQNSLLKNKSDMTNKEMHKLNTELIVLLESFKDNQSEETIDALEEKVNEYMFFYYSIEYIEVENETK